ncbi:helix-turn-helix domain-containing protein, partial [Streptomyces sp. NPDC005921]
MARTLKKSPGHSAFRCRPTAGGDFSRSCSPATAAARLGVVKNTVAYRIRRAEEILG